MAHTLFSLSRMKLLSTNIRGNPCSSVAKCFTFLELEPQVELNDAAQAALGGHPAEVLVGRIELRSLEVGVVGGVVSQVLFGLIATIFTKKPNPNMPAA